MHQNRPINDFCLFEGLGGGMGILYNSHIFFPIHPFKGLPHKGLTDIAGWFSIGLGVSIWDAFSGSSRTRIATVEVPHLTDLSYDRKVHSHIHMGLGH